MKLGLPGNRPRSSSGLPPDTFADGGREDLGAAGEGGIAVEPIMLGSATIFKSDVGSNDANPPSTSDSFAADDIINTSSSACLVSDPSGPSALIEAP